jgi:hypothetical protein
MHLASPTKRDSLEERLLTHLASSVSVSLIQSLTFLRKNNQQDATF